MKRLSRKKFIFTFIRIRKFVEAHKTQIYFDLNPNSKSRPIL